MRRPDHGARNRKGNAYPFCTRCHPGRDRSDPHARVGARRDARMAAPVWQATVVDRLVSRERPQTRRRTTRAISGARLACPSTVIGIYGSWSAVRADAFPDA